VSINDSHPSRPLYFIPVPSFAPAAFLAAVPGQFVLKDVVLLGAAPTSAGEALVASELHDKDRNRIKPA
jgi:hypothetical protein